MNLNDFGFGERATAVLERIEREGAERVRGGLMGFWTVPRTTGMFLWSLARVLRAQRVLEIGTSVGYSGIILASAIKDCDGGGDGGADGARAPILFSIESNLERYERACENFDKAGVENSVLIRAHAPEIFTDDKYFEDIGRRARIFGALSLGARPEAEEALRDLRCGDFDFAFFDATKGEYLSYFKAVFPLMRSGGIIVADNCGTHPEAVLGFLEYVQNFNHAKNIFLSLDNGLFLIKTQD